MCYTNSKRLDCSQESHLGNEVVEEGECTTVMVAEGETSYQSTSSSISRSLAGSFMAAPLAILSMIGSASGSQINSLASYHCSLASSICNLISINESKSDIIIEMEIARLNSEAETKTSFVRKDIPLTIVSADIHGEAISKQLHSMGSYLKSQYLSLMEYPEELSINTSTTSYDFCRRNSDALCDESYNRNTTISDICCPSIESYIRNLDYPTTPSTTLNSTTVASEILNSTTVASEVLNSTTVASEVLNSTTVASEVLNSTTVASEVLNSTTVASEVLNSTTVASEVLNSTTVASEVLNSTAMELTTSITTKVVPDDSGKGILTAVLAIFLFLAFAVLAFAGYKCHKARKEIFYRVAPQTSAKSNDDDVREEEDLV